MTAVSARSFLATGLAAAAVGAVAITPLPTVSAQSVSVAAPAIALSAAVSDAVQQPVAVSAAATDPRAIVPTATNPITNAYDRLEPWAAYGAELGQWALSFVPGLWWAAPGIEFAYFSIEPLVQASVFTVSYVLFAQFDQIPQAISNGFQEASQNFVSYGLAWLNSLVPLPPLPPFPPRPPFAASAVESPAGRVAFATRGTVRAEVTRVAETPGTEIPVEAAPVEVPAAVAATRPAARPAASRSTVRARAAAAAGQATPAAAGADEASAADAGEAGVKAPARKAHRGARSGG